MIQYYSHWSEVPSSQWNWPSFSPEEMACNGTGKLLVDSVYMRWLQDLRAQCGFRFHVSSHYRSPAYNMEVSTTGPDGPHTTGRATDIRIYGASAVILVKKALAEGVSGIGIKQHGPHDSRFIHLDLCPAAEGRPRPWIWSYGQ